MFISTVYCCFGVSLLWCDGWNWQMRWNTFIFPWVMRDEGDLKKKKKNLLQGCNVGAYLSQMSARTEQGWFFFLFAELQYQTSQRQMRVKSFIRPRSDACAFQIMSVIEENVNLICSWPCSTSCLREFLKLSSLIQSSDVTIWSCNLETLKSLWFKNTHQISLSPKRTGLTLDVGFVYLSLSCFCFCAW